jgi:hypothetical protein
MGLTRSHDTRAVESGLAQQRQAAAKAFGASIRGQVLPFAPSPPTPRIEFPGAV